MVKIGDKIGYLEILEDTGKRVKTYKIWKCRCTKCESVCEKSTEQLKTAKSCGCFRKDRMRVTGEKRKEFLHPNNVKAGTENSLRGAANKNNLSSGIRGVSWDNQRRKWIVQIMHRKKTYNLGRFNLLEDAANVRKDAENAVRNEIFVEWLKKYKEKY